ncbi:hypothetical protein HPB51_029702 [Rhipicephalus microplus]|uniref:Transmembrane 9 superfamily member n=1 Tax=Rhipicephalus microplus TaxID=6941 RepID=A0A9J6CTL9_RHIMP|nr:hypothetical protein HPB51_029702 [Rhipicephalus microplus]
MSSAIPPVAVGKKQVSFSEAGARKMRFIVALFEKSLSSEKCILSYFQYQDNEEVVLWMNTVGPYDNRQETYTYLSLPFCVGPKASISHYHETLGEALLGVELEFSGLDILFKAPVAKTTYCDITLDSAKLQAFIYAVKNRYWYQMYIDGLPIWGIVGEHDESDNSYYLWTHKKFEIGYNGNRIVDVNLTSEVKTKLVLNQKIFLTYEVIWKPSTVRFEERFDKYLDPSFFQHRASLNIHWFSIFNSFMMVIFLVGLVSMILMRTLRKDYARYSKDEEMDDMVGNEWQIVQVERDLGDEYGWKQVHGDVFRPPTHTLLFSALVGTGHQVAVVVLCVILFAIMGELYTEAQAITYKQLQTHTYITPTTLSKINPDYSTAYPRCGKEYKNFDHMLWLCPANGGTEFSDQSSWDSALLSTELIAQLKAVQRARAVAKRLGLLVPTGVEPPD